MEEFEKMLTSVSNYNQECMKEKRKKFESLPSFVRSGLYYSEQFKEMHHQLVYQKYFASDLLKQQGNYNFKNQDYQAACRYYEQALSVFRYVRNKKDNWQCEGFCDEDLEYFDENGKNDKEKKLVKGLKVILYQNVCLVYLKLSKNSLQHINDAFQACNEAIKLDQKSSKAYYLRAKSRLHKQTLNNEDFKLSIKDYKRALELDPENQNIIEELQKCITTFDKIKQYDLNQQNNGNRQCQREERPAQSESSNTFSFSANIQTKEKAKTTPANNIQNQTTQVNEKDKKKHSQQQSKREINDQNRKAQEIWNQIRLDKNYSDLNFDLQYEVIQKTAV